MLKSERLLFRPWTYDDSDDLVELLSNPNVCEYLPGTNGKSKEEINKWLQFFVRSFNDELGNKIFAIEKKDTKEIIGYGGLGFVKEFEQIEIMYGLKESAWRQGFGKEISLRMKKYAEDLGLTFLIALADINNQGSNKILEYTGFIKMKEIELWDLNLNYYEMKLKKH